MLRITSNRAASELAHHTKVLGRHEGRARGGGKRQPKLSSNKDNRMLNALRDEGSVLIGNILLRWDPRPPNDILLAVFLA